VLGWDLGIQMALGKVAGSEPRHRNQAPLMNPYRAADGRWFFFTGLEAARHIPAVSQALGRPDLLDDPRFAGGTGPGRRRAHRRGADRVGRPRERYCRCGPRALRRGPVVDSWSLGRGIAAGLAAFGADVAIWERDAETCASAAEAVGGLPVVTDVREADQVDRAVQATLDRHGRIDILVNNAGGVLVSSILDVSEKGSTPSTGRT